MIDRTGEVWDLNGTLFLFVGAPEALVAKRKQRSSWYKQPVLDLETGRVGFLWESVDSGLDAGRGLTRIA